ncbi:hypothetical protein niasHT_031629 [Heterodera trifolii]|uniref:Progestin and adipoQ receptor family member 3 n=1 Tax=Heterodera trifolii TaxID=157864 RepID=A0ABD2IXV3_9BILA
MGQRRCVHCQTANFCTRHNKIRLLHRDKLKPCMWLNKHIQSHYRPLELPWTLCMRSIFQWNNETVNVWSHLLGFVWFVYLQWWALNESLPSVNAPMADYWVMGTAMLCSQLCMLLSSAYHIFGCHSPQRRKQWLRADLFGVSAGLSGLYMTGLYTSFYHFPELQKFYGTLIGAMVVLIAIYVPFRRFSIQSKRRFGVPDALYLSMALIALYPTWHWTQLHGGLSNDHVRQWLPCLFALFALLGFAFAFYVSQIPERILPGKFDVIGCSHQWWHLLILAALTYSHWTGIQLLITYHRTALIRQPPLHADQMLLHSAASPFVPALSSSGRMGTNLLNHTATSNNGG